MIKALITALFTAVITCCVPNQDIENTESNNPNVVNYDDKMTFEEIKKLKLDDYYPNLLDPKLSSESDYKKVVLSWTKFHQEISSYLKEAQFQWEAADSSISIVNKIYFDKDGRVEYYVFRITNPSVSAKKKAEFTQIILDFSKNVKIDLIREEQFSQCGKTRLLTYKPTN